MSIQVINAFSGVAEGGSQWGWQVDSRGAGLITGSVTLSAPITIGSVSATVDSVYIQSGANMDFGSAWTNIGSVLVSNPTAIGSLSTQTIIGSVAVSNPAVIGSMTTQYVTLSNDGGVSSASIVLSSLQVTGSVIVSGTVPVTFSAGSVQVNAGSIAITTTPLPISGTITSLPAWGGVGSIISSGIGAVTGSVSLYNYTAWTGIGSTISSGITSVTGSVSLINSLGSSIIAGS